MPSFMESSNCRGRRPEGVIGRRHYARPDLIARLLRDRSVARFIVAPTGFGKSALAFEYADIVFEFQHVFWLNGRSPCFLRDLDKETLLAELLAVDQVVRLVVCEDVPCFSGERAALFNRFIDELLERKVEVLVTCAPSADSYASLQRDRILMRGGDLLLTDDEMIVEEMGGRLSRSALGDGLVDRIACIRWSDDGKRQLLAGLRHEELPNDMRLALLTLLVLGDGSMEDASLMTAVEVRGEVIELLGSHYAFLGIDERMSTYRCVDFGMDLLAEMVCPRIDELVVVSRYGDRDALCCGFADMLLARGKPERACAFMERFAVKSAGAQWILRRGWSIFEHGNPCAVVELMASVRRGLKGYADVQGVLLAWSAFALEDRAEALHQAKRAMSARTARDACRMGAAILALHAGPSGLRAQARKVLDELIAKAREEREGGMAASADALLAGDLFGDFDWVMMGEVALALDDDAREGLNAWLDAYGAVVRSAAGGDARPHQGVLLLAGAWLLDAISWDDDSFFETTGRSPGGDAPSAPTVAMQVKQLVTVLARFVEDMCASQDLTWFGLCAGSAIERAGAAGLRFAAEALSEQASSVIRRVEVTLFEQHDRYKRFCAAREQASHDYHLSNPDSYRPAEPREASRGVSSRTAVPTLHVRLFGGVDVRFGDDLASVRALTRQKSKTLLAILALNRGREMTKDRLVSLLWPESDLECARRNFYSVYSQLKGALTVAGERTTPYIMRSHSGYSLDMRYISCDIYAFEALCRALLFGDLNPGDWERFYGQVCNDFSEDLMPCEVDNEFVCAMRDRYRAELIDALIAASARLVHQGEPRGALWFAREAFRRDGTREDVQVALMTAQIASDQRSSALDTYFAYRRFLSQELGIDPSTRLVELYRSIIETEEPFE